ncbi:MAG: nitroreductase [Sulfobacillus acidophilus]|uniref:Nitroreductase n=1 Tax=Sulfobacillus acidophilus TaxID=53633 RepID=A0A2T2WDQ8_9FIRM|nr:MAG: nitroreductase [Sulfobacillus acidophilus]
MEIREALRSRRSVRRFKAQSIPESIIRDILSYAPWVPNHHVSEPWRFVAITGQSLEELADLRRDAVLAKRQGQPDGIARAERARAEFLEAAWVIAVIQKLDARPDRQKEDYASMAMATYNLMLVAWDYHIGSYWNTGPLLTDAAVWQWLNLSEDERPVAFVRMGYPEIIPVTRRTPIEERLQIKR